MESGFFPRVTRSSDDSVAPGLQQGSLLGTEPCWRLCGAPPTAPVSQEAGRWVGAQGLRLLHLCTVVDIVLGAEV